MLTFAAAAVGGVAVSSAGSMWQILGAGPPAQAWKTIFGDEGERGEYMDGYTEQSMIERCVDDYGWTAGGLPSEHSSSSSALAYERAGMMSHLYDDEILWDHVTMVAFAEHYVLVADDDDGDERAKKPFETFRRRKDSRLLGGDSPIFAGVILRDWEVRSCDNDEDDDWIIEEKLSAFVDKRIDYVRLECNLGSAEEIGGAARLAFSDDGDPVFTERFVRLAGAAKRCQDCRMVPLVLLQLPWREPGDESGEYFDRALRAFAGALKGADVDPGQVLFETRPPIGLSAREEAGLSGNERTSLGLDTGRKMFEVMDEAFGGDRIAGFCVAGGSTKGDFPTAMENDTQNAVRQGIRQCARRWWGYDVCFWEMGAKLMLQPEVGRLWGNGRRQDGWDAARALFRANAKDLADEIKANMS